MRNQETKNLLYSHYSSSINLNNYPPKKKILSKSPINTFNFNKVNPPPCVGKANHVQNSRNINFPNILFSKKTNSAVNLNKLNVPRNNQSNNKNFSSKNSATNLAINTPYTNYISPLTPESCKIQNYTNFTMKLNQENNNYKYTFSPILISNKSTITKKKTLILDLDETLVHSGFSQFKRKSDIILNINIDGINHIIYTLKRPFVDYFIKEMSKYYEIVIFTSSISQYASPLIDILDKEKIFSGRLYRQNCLFNNGKYIKDLKQIGKDLKDIIIIDNNPISYSMNQENAIPILTWYDDLNDNELDKLIPLMVYLSKVDDVRPIIKKIVNFQRNEINFDLIEDIISSPNKGNNNYKNDINLIYNNIKNFYNQYHKENDINNNNNINEKNYFNFIENNPNNNNLYKNKEIINSLSDMSYEEIQNEGHINNNNNIDDNNKFNNYNNDIIINKDLLKKTSDLFNKANTNIDNYSNEKLNNNNNLTYKYNIVDDKNNNNSFTPIMVIQKRNSYFSRNNPILDEQNNNNNINNNNQQNNSKINKNNENSKNDILLKDKNKKKIKINNFMPDNKENNINNHYPASPKEILERINKSNNVYNNIKNNIKVNNINENNNIITIDKEKIFINNINNRNNTNKNNQGMNINKLNNINNNMTNKNNINTINNMNINNINQKESKSKNNKNETNNNSIKIYTTKTNENNSNIIGGIYDNSNNNNNITNQNKEENKKSIFDLRREKLNEIKRKMEEINNDIIYKEDHLYQTQNNFMPNKKNLNLLKNENKDNSNNNLNKFNKINSTKNSKEIEEKKENILIKNNKIYKHNSFNKKINKKRNIGSIENDFNNEIIPYYKNIESNNINNLKNDINSLNESNLNKRTETEINNNKYNIEFNTEYSNNLNINSKNDDYITNNDLKNDSYFDSFKDKGYNFNTNYIQEIEEKQFSQSLIPKNNISKNNLFRDYLNNTESNSKNNNYDEISSINNYNLKNIFIDNNEFNYNISEGNINYINDSKENKNPNELIVNKTSSNFFHRNTIELDGEENNLEINKNIIENNINNENKYIINNEYNNENLYSHLTSNQNNLFSNNYLNNYYL